jgi:hypothetical protein
VLPRGAVDIRGRGPGFVGPTDAAFVIASSSSWAGNAPLPLVARESSPTKAPIGCGSIVPSRNRDEYHKEAGRLLLFGRLAQLVRAAGLQPAGRGFESLSAHRPGRCANRIVHRDIHIHRNPEDRVDGLFAVHPDFVNKRLFGFWRVPLSEGTQDGAWCRLARDAFQSATNQDP